MIWFGSRTYLAKLQRVNLSLQVGTSNIQPSSVVRDLGVYMDSELTMKKTRRENRCCLLLPHSSSAPGSSSGRPGSHTAAGPGVHNVQAGLLQQRVGGTANVHAAATAARPECSCPTGVRLESLRARHADPDPSALAAGQLQDKVQAVLPRPRHPLRSQPGVSDGNSPVNW